ncbi:unnamed protein product [Durusdinium trenchii]|uniref:Uncharacterized protein n=1 Tax=Durusdinium trenchii TaxID=1381693 RepID=A0ABP0RLL2_9DINO
MITVAPRASPITKGITFARQYSSGGARRWSLCRGQRPTWRRAWVLLVPLGRARRSGLCLCEGSSAVVLTSATLFAPFLRRRLASLAPQEALDPQLVATTELFVVLPGNEHDVLEASLAACLPLPPETSLEHLQVALDAAPREHMAWRPPTVGNLGVALLRLMRAPSVSCQLRLPACDFRVGERLRLLSSAFGLLKASVFLGAETECTVAAIEKDSHLLLLDGRWLPGCEGGVLLDKDGSPCALLAAPLRAHGGRWTLCPAVPLEGVLAAVLKTLAGDLLPPSLKDPPIAEAGCSGVTGLIVMHTGAEAFGCLLLSSHHVLVPATILRASGRHGFEAKRNGVRCTLRRVEDVCSLGLVVAEVQHLKDQEAFTWPGHELDLQEGRELLVVDLKGPKMATGILQRWLGARHHPQAPPALECGLPLAGLDEANVFFDSRTHAFLGFGLADRKEECGHAVLPFRFYGVSVFQLKELQESLVQRPHGEVNRALQQWAKRFDKCWQFEGSLEWRLEARPFKATSAL